MHRALLARQNLFSNESKAPKEDHAEDASANALDVVLDLKQLLEPELSWVLNFYLPHEK